MQTNHSLLALLVAALAFMLAAADDFSPRPRPGMLAPRANLCGTQQISSMDVAGCDCSSWPKGCNKPHKDCSIDCTPYSTQGVVETYKNMTYCNGGCTDKESDCEGCGLWFHTVCDCIKKPGSCKSNTAIQPKSKTPIWFLIETKPKEDNLITTNALVPGILDMIKINPAQYDPMWGFAQENYQPSLAKGAEALVLNSYRARTQEQIHIHVCERNDVTYKMLSNQQSAPGGSLGPTKDPEMFCLAIQTGNKATSFATTLGNWLNTNPKNVCQRLVGAGIMKDSRGWTWACATTNRKGPLEKFCQKRS